MRLCAAFFVPRPSPRVNDKIRRTTRSRADPYPQATKSRMQSVPERRQPPLDAFGLASNVKPPIQHNPQHNGPHDGKYKSDNLRPP